MKKGMLLVITGVVLFSVSGCRTFSESAKPTLNKAPVCAGAQDKLTDTERYYLQTWLHAAELAEEVSDYVTAIHYYKQAADYFPETPEGKNAVKQVERLKKFCNKENVPVLQQ